MKAKKWISMIAAGAMAISVLAGCQASNTASARNEETQTAENTAETEKSPEGTVASAELESNESEKTQGGKTLVVYYSASGHTEDAANTIAGATGADLFELERSALPPAPVLGKAGICWRKKREPETGWKAYGLALELRKKPYRNGWKALDCKRIFDWEGRSS